MSNKFLPLIMLIFFLSVFMTGCIAEPTAEEPGPGEPIVSPKPREGSMEITLYFADATGIEVVPEERQVPKDGEPERTIVTELIKGPKDTLLYGTWPRDITPISVETIGGITYVNMPREVLNKIQGANSEMLAVESLVKSLTDLPGVRAVQILVEGQKEQTLSGDFPIFEPVYRSIKTGHLYFSMDRLEKLQAKVDEGEETWRLDPVEVARRGGRSAGFYLNDEFIRLPESGPGSAAVEAIHEGMAYVIELEQPLGIGDGKIWSVRLVKAEFTKIKPVNYQEGEKYVYGVITRIDRDSRVIGFEREYRDTLDTRSETGSEVTLSEDAVIHVKQVIGKDENGNAKYKEVDATLDELRVGMEVGIIISADEQARAVVATQ
jgi:germination protein M